MDILKKFIEYVSIDTTSDSTKSDNPSTKGQIKLAEQLVKELNNLNIDEVYFDKKYCYVYAILKGDESLPKIGFLSHLDTSEFVSGKDIKPNILYNYDGNDIILNDNIVISKNDYPDLENHIGKTMITSDGKTLLGADDKAGIVEIMYMLEHFCHSKDEHGDIFVCFTPDEEIGLGTLHLNQEYFNPDFAYTVDGSSLGEFSYENFNAAKATIKINGIATHFGSAKGKMINAGRIATIINSLLPNDIPENTEGYEGFFCLNKISGNVINANIEYVIRDFDKENFENRKQLLASIIARLNEKYNNCIELSIEDTYYNMFEVINRQSNLIKNTLTAISKTGINPEVTPIRGGTDGTKISFCGIPCPNLGTGGHNFHSIYEYICLEDIQKSSEILISIVNQFSKKMNKKCGDKINDYKNNTKAFIDDNLKDAYKEIKEKRSVIYSGETSGFIDTSFIDTSVIKEKRSVIYSGETSGFIDTSVKKGSSRQYIKSLKKSKSSIRTDLK